MSVRESIHILRNLPKSLRNMRKPAAPSPGFVSMMMRKEWDYEQVKKFGSHAGQSGYRYGVK
jgi:hypothetical protein